MEAHSMWRRSALWFAIALLVQLAVIGGMVVAQQLATERGKAVYLRIEPVDPRDPLRGDYLTFRYSISHIPYDQVDDPAARAAEAEGKAPQSRADLAKGFERGETIWVPLFPSGGVWESQYGVVGAATKPETGPNSIYVPNQLFIKGSLESTDTSGINVVYGIEEYFIPEGTGADWPRAGVPDAKARVLVDPTTGAGQLKQVFLDGKPWP